MQESLTNVQRHSGSKVVRIRIRQHSDIVELQIEDKGHGIPDGVLGPEQQARERLGSHGGAADLKPGTTMARISDLEKGTEAIRGDLGRIRKDARSGEEVLRDLITAAEARIRALEFQVTELQTEVRLLRADVRDAARSCSCPRGGDA